MASERRSAHAREVLAIRKGGEPSAIHGARQAKSSKLNFEGVTIAALVAPLRRFGVTLDFPRETSYGMERLTADVKPASKVRDALTQYSRKVSRQKRGRNDSCHCGSGRKYKKCGLSQDQCMTNNTPPN